MDNKYIYSKENNNKKEIIIETINICIYILNNKEEINTYIYLDVQDNLGKELKVKKPYFNEMHSGVGQAMGSGVIKCLITDLLNNKLSKDIYKPRSDKMDILVLSQT